MNDKEFSPAPAEFSPPRPEFSAPPREWAAPGNEISRDDTAPPQKKRRSLPAMLVAGAAAVAIGLSCWGAAVTDNTPRAALTAEQCAYLDAVSEALLEEDIPGLEALALDPMMRQLCEEVIEPYYYDVLLPYDASYSDMVREDELYTYYQDIDYDGKTLGAINDAVDIFKLGRNLHIWYSKYESGDPSVDWDDTTWRYTQRHGDEFTYHWLDCDSRAEGLNNLEFSTYTWNWTYEDGVKWPTDIHGVRQYRAAYTQSVCKSVWISEGNAVYVVDDYRDGMIYGSVCLENGKVTLRTGDGRYETTFPVVNGRAQPGTDVEVEMRSDENGNVYASALLWHTPDGETLRIGLQTHWGQSADASNAEELYHIIVLERMSTRMIPIDCSEASPDQTGQ